MHAGLKEIWAALQKALARVKGGEEATAVLLSMKDQLATAPGEQPSLGVVEAAGRLVNKSAANEGPLRTAKPAWGWIASLSKVPASSANPLDAVTTAQAG